MPWGRCNQDCRSICAGTVYTLYWYNSLIILNPIYHPTQMKLTSNMLNWTIKSGMLHSQIENQLIVNWKKIFCQLLCVMKKKILQTKAEEMLIVWHLCMTLAPRTLTLYVEHTNSPICSIFCGTVIADQLVPNLGNACLLK